MTWYTRDEPLFYANEVLRSDTEDSSNDNDPSIKELEGYISVEESLERLAKLEDYRLLVEKKEMERLLKKDELLD